MNEQAEEFKPEQEHTEQEQPKTKLTKQQRIKGLTVVIAIITAVLLLGAGFAIVIRTWIN